MTTTTKTTILQQLPTFINEGKIFEIIITSISEFIRKFYSGTDHIDIVPNVIIDESNELGGQEELEAKQHMSEMLEDLTLSLPQQRKGKPLIQRCTDVLCQENKAQCQ